MPNYVDAYLRLENNAFAAESKAEEYRARAEENRWEQCRIAYDAVNNGGFTQSAFAREVGVSAKTISRQCEAWRACGKRTLASRPSYADAIAQAMGTTQAAETDRKQISNARAVLKDPDLARELLADPHVRAVAHEAIQEIHRSEPTSRSSSSTRGDEASLRCIEDMARVKQSLLRLVENVNDARKSGYVKPRDVREFVEEARNMLDALDDIADSRGLSDDALAEWIGAE